jgi:hypothetical protein
MTISKAIIDAVVESEESTRHVMPDGTVEWRNADGKLHRRGGPAVEYPGHGQYQAHDEWWVNGKLHREDGPALDAKNGYGEWRFNGKTHRINGPAVDFKNCRKWWVNGRQFTEDEFYMYVDQDTGEILVPPGKRLKYDYDDEDGGDGLQDNNEDDD